MKKALANSSRTSILDWILLDSLIEPLTKKTSDLKILGYMDKK